MRFVRRDGAFCVALAGGLALRVLAMIGYRPALWFVGDSYTYLAMALRWRPRPERPSGYPLMLKLLEPFHSFALVVAVQHAMTLAIAVMIYLLLRRRSVPGWAATLLVLPVLFDAYLLQLEHLVLSDTLFMFLVMSAVTLVLWRDRPGVAHIAGATALLALATLTRTVGLAVLVLFAVWLILRRVGWRALAVSAVVAVLPLATYATWYHGVFHRYTLSGAGGVFLWSRTMTFADCAKIRPPANEAALCPVASIPRSQPDAYIWRHTSPIHRLPGNKFSAATNAVAGDFAKRAILAQPGDYLATVVRGTARSFRWSPTGDYGVPLRYVFLPTEPPPPVKGFSGKDNARKDVAAYAGAPARAPKVVEPYAGWLRAYQRVVFLPGPVFGLILLAGLAGVAAAWRAWGGPALLPWTAAVVLLVVPPATADFDYRYVLPAIPLACLALGLAIPRRWTTAAPDVAAQGATESDPDAATVSST